MPKTDIDPPVIKWKNSFALHCVIGASQINRFALWSCLRIDAIFYLRLSVNEKKSVREKGDGEHVNTSRQIKGLVLICHLHTDRDRQTDRNGNTRTDFVLPSHSILSFHSPPLVTTTKFVFLTPWWFIVTFFYTPFNITIISEAEA